MVDEPEQPRARSTPSLRDVYEALVVTHRTRSASKAALNLLGHDVGGLRLPLVEADERGARGRSARCSSATACSATVAAARERHPARPAARRPGRDRQEHDGRRVRRPHRRRRRRPALPDAPRWSASTSCCPTSPTCASARTTSRRSSSRTATRTISARCRGCCASWASDEPPPVYGGPLTMAMARSKLDEHKLQRRRARGRRAAARRIELGPFDARAGPHDALDPRRERGRARRPSSAPC